MEDIPEWLNGLSDEELKNSKTLHKFPDVERLAKSYVEAEKRISNSIPLPKDENDEETLDKILTRLGKPASVDEYENPDGMDEETKHLLTEIAHKSKLTKKQYNAFAKMLLEKQKAVVEQGLNKTRQELGESFTKVESLLDKISPEIKSSLYKSGLVADPAFMKSFSKMVMQFDEDKPVDGSLKPKQSSGPYEWMNDYFRR